MATAKKVATSGRKAAPAKAAPGKSASPPVAKPAASKAAVAPMPAPEKAKKPKKPKLVRDSFTIPKAEYTVLEALKRRAAQAGAPAKKSEVLRAGLMALAAMEDGAFIAALGAVPVLKTGRPARS
jgi:hypothetical protein